MAKVITPPSIEDLDGLLELLVRPEKGVEYLKQLQQMRDAILDGLGIVKTKEAADVLLASAQTKSRQADERLAEATQAAQDAADHIERTRKAVEREIQLGKDAVTQAQRRLAAKEADLLAKEAGLNEEAKRQAAQVQELVGQQIVLKGREEYLAQEEAKLKQIKAVMASHGV